MPVQLVLLENVYGLRSRHGQVLDKFSKILSTAGYVWAQACTSIIIIIIIINMHERNA